MPAKIAATLTWSEPDGAGGHHMGSGGETEAMLTRKALWHLITRGRRADSGEEVTSVTIFTAVATKP